MVGSGCERVTPGLARSSGRPQSRRRGRPVHCRSRRHRRRGARRQHGCRHPRRRAPGRQPRLRPAGADRAGEAQHLLPESPSGDHEPRGPVGRARAGASAAAGPPHRGRPDLLRAEHDREHATGGPGGGGAHSRGGVRGVRRPPASPPPSGGGAPLAERLPGAGFARGGAPRHQPRLREDPLPGAVHHGDEELHRRHRRGQPPVLPPHPDGAGLRRFRGPHGRDEPRVPSGAPHPRRHGRVRRRAGRRAARWSIRAW